MLFKDCCSVTRVHLRLEGLGMLHLVAFGGIWWRMRSQRLEGGYHAGFYHPSVHTEVLLPQGHLH
jgi:hypothetical protein